MNFAPIAIAKVIEGHRSPSPQKKRGNKRLNSQDGERGEEPLRRCLNLIFKIHVPGPSGAFDNARHVAEGTTLTRLQ